MSSSHLPLAMSFPSSFCAASHMARVLLRNRVVPAHMARVLPRNRVFPALPLCTAAQQQNAAYGSKSYPGFCPQRSHLSALPAKPSSDAELIEIIGSYLSLAERIGFECSLPAWAFENTEGFPFEIQDDNGKSIVTLRRRYHGEDIEVTLGSEYSVTRKEHDAMNFDARGDFAGLKCECENCEDEDCECFCHRNESDDESCLARVPLTVRVRKGERSPILEFICTSSPDVVIIEAVYLKHEPSNRGMRAYEVPDFNGLNKDLQKAFYKYLDPRLGGISGISSYVYDFHIYMLDKYCREGRLRLRSMKQFLEK